MSAGKPRFDFSKHKTVLDVGGANGHLSCQLAARHPHQGGVLIAIENVIDDERRQNAFGLLMSLNMLIEFGAEGGFDYTGAQYDAWCRGAGFARTEVMPLMGPTSAAIAYK